MCNKECQGKATKYQLTEPKSSKVRYFSRMKLVKYTIVSTDTYMRSPSLATLSTVVSDKLLCY